VRTFGTVHLVTRQRQRLAWLPPSVLRADYIRSQATVQPSAGAHAAAGRLDNHPVVRGDSPRASRHSVQLDHRAGAVPAEPGKIPMLAVTELDDFRRA